jgi:hypothetical protein
MHAVLLGVTWGVLGLNAGWRPLPGGGVEYIIQIAPHEMEVFKQDRVILSEVPPQVKDIRSYRIQIGNELLPRQDPPQTPSTPASPTAMPGPAKGLPAKRTAPAYNPFSALTSLAERYPFSQGSAAPPGSSAESAKRAGERPFGGAKTPTTDRKTEEKKADDKTTKTGHPASKEPARPWLPFTVTAVALVFSLGGNLYLGWITWETRRRFRALLRRRKKAEHHLRGETHEHHTADE